MTRKLTWLTVGGAPRSGTTALGDALNKSSHIALFHEWQSALFFEAVELLFADEKRHRKFASFPDYERCMPIKERDVAQVVSAIFSVVLKKNASVVGTKFPGSQDWPRPTIPDCITEKHIHLSRNPFDCVLSAVKKNAVEGTSQSLHAAEVILCNWLGAWNHAVEQHQKDNFFHLFYECLGSDNIVMAQDMAVFLDTPCDFDLAGVVAQVGLYAAVLDQYNEAGLAQMIPFIERLFPYDQWPALAKTRMNEKKLCGYVLSAGETIHLTSDGNGWKYLRHGFYLPERDGAWTAGKVAMVLFTPERHLCGAVFVTLDVVWSMDRVSPPPVVSIALNDQSLAVMPFILGPQNGLGKKYRLCCKNFDCVDGESIALTFCIDRPQNPMQLGLSNDDRNLGVMIRSIRIDCDGVEP
jgi:hypothetical protein